MEQYVGLIIFFTLILGIVIERYIFPIFDLILQMFSNHRQLEFTNTQLQINRIERINKIEDSEVEFEYVTIKKETNDIMVKMEKPNSNAIGYQYEDKEETEEYCDDEDDCDCGVDNVRKNKTIGFSQNFDDVHSL